MKAKDKTNTGTLIAFAVIALFLFLALSRSCNGQNGNSYKDYNWTGKDKFEHCFVSAGMYVVSETFFKDCLPWKFTQDNAGFLAAATTSFFAIGIKELVWEDTPDIDDCVADLIGIGLGYWICKLFDHIELKAWEKKQIQVRPAPFGVGLSIAIN